MISGPERRRRGPHPAPREDETAAQAGIHRNTIGIWRASDDFREALASAHYDRAILYRDRAVELAEHSRLNKENEVTHF
jgi:hypothetical protein